MKEVKKYCIVSVRIDSEGEVSRTFLAYRDNWQVGLHETGDFKNPEIIWCDTLEEANIRKGNDDRRFVQGKYFMVEDLEPALPTVEEWVKEFEAKKVAEMKPA